MKSKERAQFSELESKFHFVRSNISKILEEYYNTKNKFYSSIRYSLINNGKKYRPFLLWATGRAFNIEESLLFRIGAILEMLHTYSLIHDDLPCMDNDSTRHGKPTLHREYGESTAILTGDALLTDAFAFISKKNLIEDKDIALQVINTLSTYLGSKGMVLGQALEIMDTGRRLKLNEIKKIHYLKTAKFMQVSVLLGSILAKSEKSVQRNLLLYGKNIGLVFQMQDDIEDFITDGDSINICNFLPISTIKKEIKFFIDEAIETLENTKYNFNMLIDFAKYLGSRILKQN